MFCDTISGIEMWSYVRSYAKYVNEKLCTYRVMGYDFCKVKRGSVIYSDIHSLLCISTVFVVEKCLSVSMTILECIKVVRLTVYTRV